MVSARRFRDFLQNLIKLLAISRRSCDSHEADVQTPEPEPIQTEAEYSEISEEANEQNINDMADMKSLVKKRLRFDGRIHFDDGTSKLGYRKGEEKNENNWLRINYTFDDFQELANLQLDRLRRECQAKYAFLRNKQRSSARRDDSNVAGKSEDCAAKSDDNIPIDQHNHLPIGICGSQLEDEHKPNGPMTTVCSKGDGYQLQNIGETQRCESTYPLFSNPFSPSLNAKEKSPFVKSANRSDRAADDDLAGKLTNTVMPSVVDILPVYATSGIAISPENTVWTTESYRYLQNGREIAISKLLRPEFSMHSSSIPSAGTFISTIGAAPSRLAENHICNCVCQEHQVGIPRFLWYSGGAGPYDLDRNTEDSKAVGYSNVPQRYCLNGAAGMRQLEKMSTSCRFSAIQPNRPSH
ncbi:hypothetical protein Aperf_G00000063953 [Anoplocephala perfoliata]